MAVTQMTVIFLTTNLALIIGAIEGVWGRSTRYSGATSSPAKPLKYQIEYDTTSWPDVAGGMCVAKVTLV